MSVFLPPRELALCDTGAGSPPARRMGRTVPLPVPAQDGWAAAPAPCPCVPRGAAARRPNRSREEGEA